MEINKTLSLLSTSNANQMPSPVIVITLKSGLHPGDDRIPAYIRPQDLVFYRSTGIPVYQHYMKYAYSSNTNCPDSSLISSFPRRFVN